MRALIQRVSQASVTINSHVYSQISNGLVVFLGVGHFDTSSDIDWLCQKIIKLRIFNNQEGQMGLSLLDTKAQVMIVSQFTLFASTKGGNRPSYTQAAAPAEAKLLYEAFVTKMNLACHQPVATGVFGAHMYVSLVNDGPVTIWLDSKLKE